MTDRKSADQAPLINSTYISSRLLSCLNEAEHCKVTTIVAPMGYGKSTAVRWWMDRYAKKYPETVFLFQTLTGDGADTFWRGFCRTLRKFPELAGQMKALGYPGDSERVHLLAELLEDALGEDGPQVIYILDDVHYFNAPEFSELLALLSLRLPKRMRMILISRNRIFREADRFRLGGSLCRITMDELRLRREEILEYAHLCGLPLDEIQAEELDRISEGWISLLYLLFRSYTQQGRWNFRSPDIFRLMDQVMYEPLDVRKRRFLLVNGLADVFTRKQAAYLWQEADSDALLDDLTEENAFISCDGESGAYRFHNMLRDVVRAHFRALPEMEQQKLLSRLGHWQMEQGDYLAAADTFYQIGDWEQLLNAIVRDRSKSFGGEYGAILTKWCAQCPEELLLCRPDALLVLMLNLYTCYNITEMLRLYGLFQQSMEQNRELNIRERNNLLGEAEIMLSFLKFNDISAMSVHHRRACELLDRPSYSMGNESPWTFGCPSILMTYHRAAGSMDLETAEMRECIPYYSRVTEEHGKGADHVMEGETFLMRGETVSAEIACHRAVEAAAPKGQFSILITAALLASKLAILAGRETEVFAPLERLFLPLRENRQYVLLPSLDMCRGWLCALLGHPREAPAWLLGEDAASSVMTPALPMLQIIVNQILLARGAYSQVAARWHGLHDLCEQFHYLLCDIYLRLQVAAALLHLGRQEEGELMLKTSVKAAFPDRIFLPFAEVDDLLVKCLEEQGDLPADEIRELAKLAGRFRRGRDKIRALLWKGPEKAALQKDWGLSRRELEIARLAAAGMTGLILAGYPVCIPQTVQAEQATETGRNTEAELEAETGWNTEAGQHTDAKRRKELDRRKEALQNKKRAESRADSDRGLSEEERLLKEYRGPVAFGELFSIAGLNFCGYGHYLTFFPDWSCARYVEQDDGITESWGDYEWDSEGYTGCLNIDGETLGMYMVRYDGTLKVEMEEGSGSYYIYEYTPYGPYEILGQAENDGNLEDLEDSREDILESSENGVHAEDFLGVWEYEEFYDRLF